MDRLQTVWRYSFLTYIVFFCMTGVAELITISYILLRRYSIRYFIESIRLSIFSSYAAPALVAVITYVGWTGAIRRSSKLLKAFSVIVALTISLEVTLSIWTFIEREDLGRITKDNLDKSFTPGTGAENTDWWDSLQSELYCCGVLGPGDYRDAKASLPFSCCQSFPLQAVSSCSTLHTQGCLIPLIKTLGSDFSIVSLCLIISALIQLPGLFASWTLANRIQQGTL